MDALQYNQYPLDCLCTMDLQVAADESWLNQDCHPSEPHESFCFMQNMNLQKYEYRNQFYKKGKAIML